MLVQEPAGKANFSRVTEELVAPLQLTCQLICLKIVTVRGKTVIDPSLFDLNRVEVLNGPQGTLYGATSLGGTVKYVTALPDPKAFSADVDTEVSSTEHGGVNHAYRGMINMPFGDGLGAVRIDGFQQYDAGYVRDPVYDRDNQGWDRPEGGRISVLLQPTDQLDVRLTALTQHIPGESDDVAFRDPVTHQPTIGTYDQAYPTFQPSKYGLTLYSGVVNYDLPFAKLTSITGFQNNQGVSRTDESYVYDPALAAFGGGTAPFNLYVDTTTKKFTEELRLASHQNSVFNWLVGEMTPILQEWIQWRLYLLHAFFCAVSFVVGKSPPRL